MKEIILIIALSVSACQTQYCPTYSYTKPNKYKALFDEADKSFWKNLDLEKIATNEAIKTDSKLSTGILKLQNNLKK